LALHAASDLTLTHGWETICIGRASAVHRNRAGALVYAPAALRRSVLVSYAERLWLAKAQRAGRQQQRGERGE
jgi:hypothetical protein